MLNRRFKFRSARPLPAPQGPADSVVLAACHSPLATNDRVAAAPSPLGFSQIPNLKFQIRLQRSRLEKIVASASHPSPLTAYGSSCALVPPCASLALC